MKTMRVVTWIAVAGLVTAAGALGVARAMDKAGGPPESGWGMHDGGFPGMAPMRGLLHDLDLTDEQRSRLRDIARTGWESSTAQRAELQALRKQIESTVIANGFNEAEVRGLIEAREPLLTSMLVDMVRVMTDMRNVLTPEQQQRFDARRAEFEARRGDLRPRTGTGKTPAGDGAR